MLCENCGAENKDDANFCIACGCKLKIIHRNQREKTHGFIVGMTGVIFLIVISWIAGMFWQNIYDSKIQIESQNQGVQDNVQVGNDIDSFSDSLPELTVDQEYITANDVRAFFLKCVFYGEKNYKILPNDYYDILKDNDDESGCMGKVVSLFADEWIVYIYYGLTKDEGVMELPYITTVGTVEKLNSVAEEITSVYGKGADYYIENTIIYVWPKAIDDKYDLWLSKKDSEENIYLDFIKCTNISDHSAEGIENKLSGNVIINKKSDDKEKGNIAKILLDGKLYTTLRLDEDTIISVESKDGYNIIEVSNGYVFVKEADCPNQTCVNEGRVNKSGGTIICLPHKLVIQVELDSEIDTIVR